MQIVITLPDAYAEIIPNVQNGSVASKIILEAVKGGIVLPKNHGDLVDADEDMRSYFTIWNCKCSEYGEQTVMAVDDVRYLPAVIPATEGRIKERSY